MENGYSRIFTSEWAFLSFLCVFRMLTDLISLCGMAGNGTVIWLLGFRLKRNPVHVYILHLAVADFTYVFSYFLNSKLYYWRYSLEMVVSIVQKIRCSSFLVGQCLLMAVSTERCVSVLWPLWYRCHRPEHLSTLVCALIWVLSFCEIMSGIFCLKIGELVCYVITSVCYCIPLVTSLVLCVSSLTMILRVQSCSQMRRPGKLYLTTLLTVSAFVLLSLPGGVLYAVYELRNPRSMVRYRDVIYILNFLDAMNCTVNPIIYFFVGRHRQKQGRKPLEQVLQSALMDEEEGTEQRTDITVPGEEVMFPEHQEEEFS